MARSPQTNPNSRERSHMTVLDEFHRIASESGSMPTIEQPQVDLERLDNERLIQRALYHAAGHMGQPRWQTFLDTLADRQGEEHQGRVTTRHPPV